MASLFKIHAEKVTNRALVNSKPIGYRAPSLDELEVREDLLDELLPDQLMKLSATLMKLNALILIKGEEASQKFGISNPEELRLKYAAMMEKGIPTPRELYGDWIEMIRKGM